MGKDVLPQMICVYFASDSQRVRERDGGEDGESRIGESFVSREPDILGGELPSLSGMFFLLMSVWITPSRPSPLKEVF